MRKRERAKDTIIFSILKSALPSFIMQLNWNLAHQSIELTLMVNSNWMKLNNQNYLTYQSH